MARARSTIPSSVRERVLLPGRCAYCGATDGLVIDHVFPHSRGGTDAEHNLTPSCEPCNSEKGDLTVQEWKAWRERAGLTWPVERRPPTTPAGYEEQVGAWVTWIRHISDSGQQAIVDDDCGAAALLAVERVSGTGRYDARWDYPDGIDGPVAYVTLAVEPESGHRRRGHVGVG